MKTEKAYKAYTHSTLRHTLGRQRRGVVVVLVVEVMVW